MDKHDPNRVHFFDTTLRDGEQAAGINLNVAEKLQIAKQLASLGMDVIEAGFSAASPGDFACVESIAREVRGSTICSLARTKEGDIKASADSLKNAEKSRIHVFIATSPLHMEYKLKMTPAQVLEQVRTAVPLARSLSGEVEFSAEDASRSELPFLIEVFKAAVAGGATVLNIPDTVGYAIPNEFAAFCKKIIDGVGAPANVIYSVHAHNDLGLAVANSLAAVGAGVRQVEGTMNALGERGGNAALEEVIMALKTRNDHFNCAVGVDTTKIVSTSRMVSRLTGVPILPNKPIVGANAFAHESGIHQHGVLAHRETYEIMKGEDVGAEAAVMVLGKHSGRHAFRDRLIALGYTLSAEQLDKSFATFKTLCDEKKDVTDSDIEALVAAEIITSSPERKYSLDSYYVEIGSEVQGGPTARVVLNHGDKRICDAAVGNGPIDAAYLAMQRIVKLDLTLENFAINATSRASDSQGEAQVTVRHSSGLSASGRGLSTDTVEACIKAYVSAVNNLYMVAAAKEIKINGN